MDIIEWLRVAAVVIALAILGFISVTNQAHAETCRASFYDHGARTASGERFRPMGMTFAHRSWPFGTKAKICHRGCAVATLNDRGPFVPGRCIDASRGLARAIGLEASGVGNVTIQRLN